MNNSVQVLVYIQMIQIKKANFAQEIFAAYDRHLDTF